jgi:putative SOS response-associated peptidase YedK
LYAAPVCDRYVLPDSPSIERVLAPEQRWWQFQPSFNVAPGRTVPVIRLHERRSEGVMMRWGLVPAWAEGDPTRASLPHLRASELGATHDTRQSWLAGQRCLLPAGGFYLWERTPAGYRQPYFVRLEDTEVIAMAGLWDRSTTSEDDVIESCAILVVPVSEALAYRHPGVTHVPALLAPEQQQVWLHGTPAQAKALLQASGAASWSTHPVSPRVNSLKYDDALLTDAVAADAAMAAGR